MHTMNMGQKHCTLCPRKCTVDRTKTSGYCGAKSVVRVARASLHMWEEPCISGQNGSGTIFFSGCPLKCVFCQNRSIALGSKGRKLTEVQLSELFLLLQEKGAEKHKPCDADTLRATDCRGTWTGESKKTDNSNCL